MHRDPALDGLLQVGRQRLVGREHVGEIGVAARFRRRHLQRVQHRGLRRHVDIGHVGVPHRLAVAEIADRLAVLDHVGDDVELRMLLEKWLAIGIGPGRIELAEVLAEGDQLRVRKLLAVHDDDQPLPPCGLDGIDVGLRQRPGDVDAGYFRANAASRFLIDRVIASPRHRVAAAATCRPACSPAGIEHTSSGCGRSTHETKRPGSCRAVCVVAGAATA